LKEKFSLIEKIKLPIKKLIEDVFFNQFFAVFDFIY